MKLHSAHTCSVTLVAGLFLLASASTSAWAIDLGGRNVGGISRIDNVRNVRTPQIPTVPARIIDGATRPGVFRPHTQDPDGSVLRHRRIGDVDVDRLLRRHLAGRRGGEGTRGGEGGRGDGPVIIVDIRGTLGRPHVVKKRGIKFPPGGGDGGGDVDLPGNVNNPPTFDGGQPPFTPGGGGLGELSPAAGGDAKYSFLTCVNGVLGTLDIAAQDSDPYENCRRMND